MRQLGFTLIELVLVVALIGILAVASFPLFTGSFLTNARSGSMRATAGAVQSGIALYAATQAAAGNGTSYPSTLDSAATNSTASDANPLFGTVLQNGVTDQWFKVSGTCYVYDTNGNKTKDANPTDTYYSYNSTTGTFAVATGGCT